MQTLKTYCRNCQSACGMEADVEDGRIIAIRGDRDHPISAGYSCIKGQYSKAFHGGDDRLTTVLRRQGDSFVEITSDDALDDIASRLRTLLDTHGPRSIALYCGTALAFAGLAGSVARSWLAGIGSPELYSNFTVDQSAKWVTMGRLGLFATGKPSIDDVDAMLLFGYNPMVSHMGFPLSPIPAANPGKAIADARARGAQIIVVDPRRTETARRADMHLQIRPSEDATLLAAMINLVFTHGWHDADFCARFLTSVERLRAAVAPFTPDHAAARVGIPAEQIVEATRIFATARRKVAASGTGANMCERSNLVEHLVESLNAICGNYRRAGDPIHTRGAIFEMVPDIETVVPPSRGWENGPKLRSADIGRINGEFPSSRLAAEILHDGEDRIRALVCVGGNPATALAGSSRVAEALRSLDLLVVLDPRMSETARMADYVIPTALPYERFDLTSYADNWFYRDFAQATRPLLSPPPGVLEDWQIFWEIARRMGTPIPFKAGPYGVSRAALGDATDLDMTERPTSEALLRLVCKNARVSFDELLDHPSGVVLSKGGVVRAAPADDGARLNLCPDDVSDEIAELRAEQSASSGFPYRLITRRSPHLINSAFKNAGAVKRKFPRPPIYMNPDDIAAEQLTDGEPVMLASRFGQISGCLVADPTLRRGAIAASACWDTVDDPDGSSLTSHLISPDEEVEAINFMPLQSGVRVKVLRSDDAA